jgi:hypothetical protein
LRSRVYHCRRAFCKADVNIEPVSFITFPFFLEGVIGRNDDIGTISRDVDVTGLVQGNDPVSDSTLLRIGVVSFRPIRAGARAVPFVRRKFVDDGGLIGTGGDSRPGVVLVEAVNELMHGHHHVCLFSRGRGWPRG